MRMLLRLSCVGLLLGALVGCSDSPTAPVPSQSVAQFSENGPAYAEEWTGTQGCVLDGLCSLPPIVVDGGGCDPWLDLNWCQGDGGGMCMTDAGPGMPYSEIISLSNCQPGGPGGGGGSTGDGDWSDPCDPMIHPDCEQPLTAADLTTINNALATMLRPETQYTDSVAARQCAEMEEGFRTALAEGAVFRGAFDSDSTNDPYGSHYGMHSGGRLHFDPATLDAANRGNTDAIRELAITALHEAAHRMGDRHLGGVTFDSLGRDYYTDSPFNRLNPGPNSCVPR